MTDPVSPGRARNPWHRLPRKSLRLAFAVLPLIAIVNVGLLVWSLDGADFAGRIVAPELLLLAAMLVFVPMLATTWRIVRWCRFLNVPMSLRGSLRVVTGTIVAKSVMPTAAGGAPMKALFLLAEDVEPRRVATLISLQTAEDALVLYSLVAIGLGVTGAQVVDFFARHPAMLIELRAGIMLTARIALCVLAALLMIGVSGAKGLLGVTIQDRITRVLVFLRGFAGHVLGDWLGVMRQGKAVALGNLGLAASQWTARFSIAGLVLAAFGSAWHPALYWLLQYLVQAISSVVPTPGAAGGAEAAFLLLYAPFVAANILIAAMSAWRLLFFYLPLAGAAAIMFLLQRADRRDELKKGSCPGSIDRTVSQPAE